MPKIIGKTLEEHREHTRSRLFAAMSELLALRGFDALTMAEIAAQAQVGRTAVYNHFPDKEALLLAYISHETADYSARLTEALERETDPVAQLRIYIRQQLELRSRYRLAPGPDLHDVMTQSSAAELHSHATLVEDVLLGILRRGIKAGLLPNQDLTAVIPLIHASLSGWKLPTDPSDHERFVAAVEGYVLRAVGVTTAVSSFPGPAEAAAVSAATIIGGACPVDHVTTQLRTCPVKH